MDEGSAEAAMIIRRGCEGRRRSGGRGALLGSAAVLLAALGPRSFAQEPELGIPPNVAESTEPDVESGKLIAGKLCVGCHLIDKTADGPTQTDAPSFPSIADRPNQSVEGLTTWLLAPHAPMPDPQLTRKEIRDLAGYIFSLRTAP
jgi:mono/diheme cytochrome c family protein